ncbi:uncharacterized protein LOC116264844 isoform X1 [Nymphaea colorata]|nr:uncharacterized protein LOC116264844 isoform X1 [Nymphaea colorata]
MRLQRSLECCAWISAGFTGQGYLWRYLQLPSPLGQLGTLQAFNFGGGPVDPFLPQRDPISASTPAHGQTSSPSLFLMLPNPSQAYHVPISLSFAPSTHHHQMTKTQAARLKWIQKWKELKHSVEGNKLCSCYFQVPTVPSRGRVFSQ